MNVDSAVNNKNHALNDLATISCVLGYFNYRLFMSRRDIHLRECVIPCCQCFRGYGRFFVSPGSSTCPKSGMRYFCFLFISIKAEVGLCIIFFLSILSFSHFYLTKKVLYLTKIIWFDLHFFQIQCYTFLFVIEVL